MNQGQAILETRQEVASLIAAANRRLLSQSRPPQEAAVHRYLGDGGDPLRGAMSTQQPFRGGTSGIG